MVRPKKNESFHISRLQNWVFYDSTYANVKYSLDEDKKEQKSRMIYNDRINKLGQRESQKKKKN